MHKLSDAWKTIEKNKMKQWEAEELIPTCPSQIVLLKTRTIEVVKQEFRTFTYFREIHVILSFPETEMLLRFRNILLYLPRNYFLHV
jgi:hypothetical protein